MKLTSIFAVLFTAVMFPIDINAAITIDTYTAGTTLTQFGAGTASQTTTSATILGGQRQEALIVTNQGGGEFFGIIGFSGEMDVAQGSLDQIMGGVVYNSFGTIDMTQGGLNNAFELGFLSSDINAPLSNVVSLTVGSGAGSSQKFVTVPQNSSLPQNILVNFADFAGVDFTTVNSVALNFDFSNNPGRDFELGLFSATSAAVPEPTAGFVLGVGALALTVRRRRQR